jgi:hypothetical protein
MPQIRVSSGKIFFQRPKTASSVRSCVSAALLFFFQFSYRAVLNFCLFWFAPRTESSDTATHEHLSCSVSVIAYSVPFPMFPRSRIVPFTMDCCSGMSVLRDR